MSDFEPDCNAVHTGVRVEANITSGTVDGNPVAFLYDLLIGEVHRGYLAQQHGNTYYEEFNGYCPDYVKVEVTFTSGLSRAKRKDCAGC